LSYTRVVTSRRALFGGTQPGVARTVDKAIGSGWEL